jgi:hypothetical protein
MAESTDRNIKPGDVHPTDKASEPWELRETKLVAFSILIGIGVLVLGGILVSKLLL